MEHAMIRCSSAHRHYPSSFTAVISSSYTSSSWSRPRSSSSSNSNSSNNNGSSIIRISRYPYLDKEPLVNGVYLRPLVDSRPEDFHVPLEPRIFAYALKRELLAADQIVRMRTRLYSEHPPHPSHLSLSAAIQQIDVKATDKHAVLLYLGASRLLQCWVLPEDVWCTVLAPQLISNLTNCISMLLASQPDTIPPPMEATEGEANSNHPTNHPNHPCAKAPLVKALVDNSEERGAGNVDEWDDDDALQSRSSGFLVAASAVIALARSLNHRLLPSSSETSKHHTICEDDSDTSDEEEEEEEAGGSEGASEEGGRVGVPPVESSQEAGEPELEGDGGSEMGAEGNDISHVEEDVITRQQRGGSVASHRSSQYDELNNSLSVRWTAHTHNHHQGWDGQGLGQGRRRVVMSGRGPGQLLKSSAAALAQLIVMAGECVEQVTPLSVRTNIIPS